MSRPVDAAGAAQLLRDAEDIHILTHTFPDGDTLGCGFGLCRALRALGKRAQVLCADLIPEKYGYMLLPEQDFEPAFLCAVDVADPQLLGSYAPLAASVALAIDHHPSQTMWELAVSGIATDTGCFKYSNTTPKTHLMAARLMECGAPADAINREMFDMKSRARLEIERQALAGIRFAFGDRCAVMTITRKMISDAGAAEGDLEGLAPLPRQIEGVWVGVTMREKEDGRYKVSLRTGTHADASKICARLGGGGHVCAAGCTVSGSAQEAVDTVLSAIAAELPEITA